MSKKYETLANFGDALVYVFINLFYSYHHGDLHLVATDGDDEIYMGSGFRRGERDRIAYPGRQGICSSVRQCARRSQLEHHRLAQITQRMRGVTEWSRRMGRAGTSAERTAELVVHASGPQLVVEKCRVAVGQRPNRKVCGDCAQT